MAEVRTDNAGEFSATFDLRYDPSLEADRTKWRKARAIVTGTYSAQARIVVSDDIARAESAMVFHSEVAERSPRSSEAGGHLHQGDVTWRQNHKGMAASPPIREGTGSRSLPRCIPSTG
jgi:hypothetical protein